ncbi:hypothetical protein DVP82_23485 [Yersinia enterocolitica]|nr:hypothetical protein [Yersinia enterocolitica]
MDKHIEVKSTTAANWRQEGKTDPHNTRYECQRVDLTMGQLTDDEIANAVFLCDHRTSFDSIVYLTAAKDRIRWLSRSNEALIAQLEAAQQELIKPLPIGELVQRLEGQTYEKWFSESDVKDLRERAEAAEAALSAANEKLKGEQVPVAVIVLSKNWPDTGRKVIDYYIEKIQQLPVGTELFTAPQKPVVLPEAYAVRAGHPINEGERNVMIPKQDGNWLSRFDVEHAIKAAGGKVEGE